MRVANLHEVEAFTTLDGSTIREVAGPDLVTHRLPLEEAPRGSEIFQKTQDGAIKVVLSPH